MKNNYISYNNFRKSLFTITISMFLTTLSFSQGESNVWYFGKGNGLDFNFSPPAQLENGNVNLEAVATGEGVGSISDANGNLLFYTNGSVIYDKNHTAMPNGSTLNGDDNTVQTGLIVPVQGSTTKYYAIQTGSGGGKPVKYVIVDMTLNGGLGDVVLASRSGANAPNGATIVASAGEGSLAIPEYNLANTPTGNYWVIQHSSSSAAYYVSKATSAGISAPVTQTVGTASVNGVMMFKTNSCFDKIGVAYYNSDRVEILPFNNVTGVISAPTTTLVGTGGAPFINPEVYGIEFSPNGQFLYVTESGLNSRKTIYQFDLSAGTGLNPVAVLASKSSYTGGAEVVRFGAAQLGPDGKIYFPGWNPAGSPGYMNVIPTPDVAWTKPNPTLGTDLLYQKYTYLVNQMGEGLPPVLKNLLTSVKIYYNNACEGGITNFSFLFGGGVASQTWNFGDPGSGAANTSTSPTPSHTYALAGTYTVTLNLVDNCGRTRTGTVNVIIKTGPVVTVPGGTCPNTNITFAGTGANSANYTWSNNPTGTPVIFTGANYVYNGPLPKTIYVKDPTPLAIDTVGQSSEPDCFAPSTGIVYFETYTSLTVTSFQLQCKTAPAAANISIQNDLGTITYWGPVAAPVAASALLTMSPNVTLSAGKYRLFSSTSTTSFCRNVMTNPDGGRDVGGVINVTGENNGIKAGSFMNIIISIPDPCGIRAYTAVDLCTAPVTLLEFYGEYNNNKTNLFWEVAKELNNDYFLVQRSSDGINFIDIGKVKGRGTVNTTGNYMFTDASPLNNVNYYRLAQFDFDGKVTYSNILVFQPGIVNVTVAPNPFTGNTTLAIPSDEKLEIEILDLTGRLVHTITKETEQQKITVGENLSQGTYILRIVLQGQVFTSRITKE
jgi:hypothetical protein